MKEPPEFELRSATKHAACQPKTQGNIGEMRCSSALAPVANGHMGGRDTPQGFGFEVLCARSRRSEQTQPECALQESVALVHARAAVVCVREGVGAFPAAVGQAGGAGRAALTVAARCGSVRNLRTCLAARSAVVHVGFLIDAASAARAEGTLTLERAFALVAFGSRMRRGRAHLVARPAVGSVTRGVDARVAAVRLRTAIDGAFTVLADLPSGAGLTTAVAILRIRLRIHALVRTVEVVRVTAHLAAAASAAHRAVRCRDANFAAVAAVARVVVELLADAVAQRVARVTAQPAFRAHTLWARV